MIFMITITMTITVINFNRFILSKVFQKLFMIIMIKRKEYRGDTPPQGDITPVSFNLVMSKL